MAAFMPVISQETLTVYDCDATSGFVPVFGFYADAYNKCQMIMPADDLSDMVGGTISKLTWYLATPATGAWGANFQIYLSEVSQTVCNNNYFDISGATLVYEGALDGTQSTMEIVFTQDYTYDGGNLLISVYETETGSWIKAFFTGATVSGASIGGYSYASFEEVNCAKRDFLPKTTFTYDPIGVVVYRKPKNLAVSDITTHSATITWDAGGDETTWGIEYKKAADEEWTSAGTVTEKTIALDALANGVKYDVRVKSIYAHGESEWVQISFSTLAFEGEGTNVTPTPHPTASTTKWYQIKTQDNCYLYFNWDEERVMATSSPSTDDAYLFCFVYDEMDSSKIHIYNRADQGYMTYGDRTEDGYISRVTIDYVEWNNDDSFFYIYFRDYDSYKYYLSYNPGSQYGSIGYKNGSFTASEVVTAPLVTVPYNTLAPIDFHIPHNDLDNEGDEGYAKLIDQNRSTKWCVENNSGTWETIWLDFESDVWFIPKGYTLTTGNDTGSHNNRNPKEWVIYGKTFEDDDWTELVHVTDGRQAGLGTMSSTEYSFDITGATKGYRYFRFEVRQIRGQEANNKYIFQLAELKFLGTYVDAPEPPIPGDVTGDGTVDVSDVNAVINMMLGKMTQTAAGDVNGDGNVDVSDVNAVINIMLGKTTPVTPPVVDPTPQTLTATGYNIPHNGLDNEGNEGYAKLVDGDRTTKWCVENRSGSWETIWIDLKSDVAFKPTSYILTTGNDTHTCPTRNPKNWKIYGRNSESESWTELAHVTDGSGLGTASTTDYTFEFNGVTKAYQYYRFEVIENGGGDHWNSAYYIFQLGELTLVGVPQ